MVPDVFVNLRVQKEIQLDRKEGFVVLDEFSAKIDSEVGRKIIRWIERNKV